MNSNPSRAPARRPAGTRRSAPGSAQASRSSPRPWPLAGFDWACSTGLVAAGHRWTWCTCSMPSRRHAWCRWCACRGTTRSPSARARRRRDDPARALRPGRRRSGPRGSPRRTTRRQRARHVQQRARVALRHDAQLPALGHRGIAVIAQLETVQAVAQPRRSPPCRHRRALPPGHRPVGLDETMSASSRIRGAHPMGRRGAPQPRRGQASRRDRPDARGGGANTGRSASTSSPWVRPRAADRGAQAVVSALRTPGGMHVHSLASGTQTARRTRGASDGPVAATTSETTRGAMGEPGIDAHAEQNYELRAGALRPEAGPRRLHRGPLAPWRRSQVGGARLLARARESASYPLVPYSNRDRRRVLQLAQPVLPAGSELPGARTRCTAWAGWRPNAGPGAARRAARRGGADAGAPRRRRLAVRLQRTPRSFSSAPSLRCELVVTNIGAEPAPVGLGWHPSFRAARSRYVGAAGAGRSTPQLPKAVPQPGVDADVAHLAYDHCFEGWVGPARIRDERFSR